MIYTLKPELLHFRAVASRFCRGNALSASAERHVISAFQRSSSGDRPDLVPVRSASRSFWRTCFPPTALSASDLVRSSRASPDSLRFFKRITGLDFFHSPRIACFRSFNPLCWLLLPVAVPPRAIAVRLRRPGWLGRHCCGDPCSDSIGLAPWFSRDLSGLECAWVRGHPLRCQHSHEIGPRRPRLHGNTSSLSLEPPPNIYCPHNHFHTHRDISAIERRSAQSRRVSSSLLEVCILSHAQGYGD